MITESRERVSIDDDYDTPWKDAVTPYFPEFMAFYFPDATARIDWARGYTFLDQELAQVVQDAELGKRLIDKLVQITTHEHGERWVYIHIEIQGGHDHRFAERMFSYNYRLYDKYRRPIASLAVLADDRDYWKPTRFGYELFGCRMGIDFPVVKLLDYHKATETLLDNPNSFALVTAAHLLTRQTKHDNQQRYAAKWLLAKLLYERDWDKQLKAARVVDRVKAAIAYTLARMPDSTMADISINEQLKLRQLPLPPRDINSHFAMMCAVVDTGISPAKSCPERSRRGSGAGVAGGIGRWRRKYPFSLGLEGRLSTPLRTDLLPPAPSSNPGQNRGKATLSAKMRIAVRERELRYLLTYPKS